MPPRGIAIIRDSILRGETSAQAVLTETLAAIRRSEDGPDALNAFLSVADAQAFADAERLDEAVRAGKLNGVLAGVPVALKDNICTLDLPTTCGSRILEHYRCPFEATVVRKLRAAGAFIVGKTNMDEFAMGSSTENSAYGPTRNPLDRTRVPGGSSGGSAAAVAADLVPAALGSETGGSVRQPAAFCGVVGSKPTYGRVSRYGLVAFGSSLDQVGTFAHTVEDAALLLEVIAGHEPLDSTSANQPVPRWSEEATRGVEGLTIGLPTECFGEGLSPEIGSLCLAALDKLAKAGTTIREISLPHTKYAVPTYYVIAPAEASSNLARYDGVRYGLRAADARTTHDVYLRTRSAGFGAEVKRRIMLGTFALSAGYQEQYYGRAQHVRRCIANDFRRAFQDGVDVIFTPTTPTTAFRLGERVSDPYEMYLSDVYTVTANLAGIPGISVPIGKVDGLPVGGQFLADHWREDLMFRVAGALERELKA